MTQSGLFKDEGRLVASVDVPRDALHRELRGGDYWKVLPGYSGLTADEFHSHEFQQRNTVTDLARLRAVLGDLVPDSFYSDLADGIRHAPMALRITPHLMALIDWEAPDADPIRTQFLPLRSRQQVDHPMMTLDSLQEQRDSPVPGLTHRYPDKALFLPVDTCPVYCRFCTRSYAVGADTERVSEKLKLHANRARWEQAFRYIEETPRLEDIVVSGGDAFHLRPDALEEIGRRLIAIPHVRRIRIATKGLCVMPQKILTDHAWVDALARVSDLARREFKQLALHTHINHPSEIAEVTQRAMRVLVERGVLVRCQTVMQHGVNADGATMQLLVRRLGWVNILPYYVYFHDMVPGVEELRTSLAEGLAVEKQVRGVTAGFNTPAFVVDTMGGGGKRDAHSFEVYHREHGIAVYRSPSVRPGRMFFYFDPIRSLSEGAQERWVRPSERRRMLDEVEAMASD
jgi:lysine 2,3-aminomutase